MVRAKFVVDSIEENRWGSKTVKLKPEYDDNIPEDRRFAKATPTGHLEMVIENEAALEEFQLGKAVYLDFTPVVEEASQA